MALTPRIDIHCHLLPDWDDGPRNMAESLAMARRASASGVQTIVATPHVERESVSRPDRPASTIAAAVQQLQQQIEAEGIDLRVLPGAEVALSPTLPSRLADEPWLCLGGQDGYNRHILVELPPGAPWTSEVDEVLFQIALRGVSPILAHPERYADVQRDIALARRAAERGVLLQITARSLAEDRSPAGQSARALAQAGLVSFVASDAHTSACGLMIEAASTLTALLGVEGAQQVLVENPRRLLEGHDVRPAASSAVAREGGQTSKQPFFSRLLGLGRGRAE